MSVAAAASLERRTSKGRRRRASKSREDRKVSAAAGLQRSARLLVVSVSLVVPVLAPVKLELLVSSPAETHVANVKTGAEQVRPRDHCSDLNSTARCRRCRLLLA